MMIGKVLVRNPASLGLCLAHHCDTSTSLDCKALANLIWLNFEFSVSKCKKYPSYFNKINVITSNHISCFSGAILLKTAASINDVTLIMAGDG